MFMIGYRDFINEDCNKKRSCSITYLCMYSWEKATDNFQELYSDGLLIDSLDFDYEFSKNYSHILISGESDKYKEAVEQVCNHIENDDINEEDFERAKKESIWTMCYEL